MSDVSARLALPYLLPAQAQKHVTHNEALERLDTLVQLVLEEVGAETPPALPEEGQVWALGSAPTGDWAAEPGRLARYTGSGWLFVTPAEGWMALEGATARVLCFDGSDWSAPAAPDLGGVPGVGVGTSWDAVNRLSVVSAATLLSHDGAGHQIKVNKAGAADTASLLFQTGWSGRAEMGTAGSDDFAIKVSADGSAWHTALSFDAASGIASGQAVQQSAGDVTPGRLARADYAYGPGNLLGVVAQSAGQPTGAVIEQGSNANGSYVRFADGTQICSHVMPVGRTTSGLCSDSWTYPVAFVTPPHGVFVQLESTGSATPTEQELAPTRVQNATATDVDIRQPRISGMTSFVSGDYVDIYAMAVGRWF